MELDPVDRITADAVGEPGQRTFFLQARKDEDVVSIVIEKEQLRLLSASIIQILERVGKETDPSAVAEEELELEQPVVPDWRAGRMSIGYEESRDLLVLVVEELVPDDEEDRDADEATFWASREQMLALARHGAAVVTKGRATCEYCGLPIDPAGHWCPAGDGHREIGSV